MEPSLEWTELDRQQVFARYARKIDRVRFRLPDGTETDYFVKNEPPTVGVVAVTADLRVVLVEQFRPGPKRVLLELPGGYVDSGEEPAFAARRELLEETGYDGSLFALGQFYDCAYSTRVRHYFVATGCAPVSTRSAGEMGRIRLVSLASFVEILRTGALTDAVGAFAGLEYLTSVGLVGARSRAA